MHSVFKFPLYLKTACILVSIAIVVAFLFLGQHILIPIFLSLLFSILLTPIVSFLHLSLRIPNVIASTLTVVLFSAIIALIITIVSIQIGDMTGEIKTIKANISVHYHSIQLWIKNNFSISFSQQDNYMNDVKGNSLGAENIITENRITSLTDVLLNLVLVPLYTFLFLLYKNLCSQFLFTLVKKDSHILLSEILLNIKVVVKSYLVGLIIEMLLVATLTSIGFMIIGVKYAVLLGIITGLLNLIPYIGILIAGILSIIATLGGTTSLSLIVGVVVVNFIVQFIDNNFLVPLVVSSKVKINAYASIVGIIVGGSIAGFAGMFLAIPTIAIMKVIFDRIESLKPWGFILGDTIPKTSKFSLKIKSKQ